MGASVFENRARLRADPGAPYKIDVGKGSVLYHFPDLFREQIRASFRLRFLNARPDSDPEHGACDGRQPQGARGTIRARKVDHRVEADQTGLGRAAADLIQHRTRVPGWFAVRLLSIML